METPKVNVDIKSTTPIVDESGNQLFSEGVLLRRVSKFISGTSEDSIMPIPVFYNVRTGLVCLDTLPYELREEYKIYNGDILKSQRNKSTKEPKLK